MIIVDICLSDIPASARNKSEKNNKWYAKICVAPKKEIDKFGNSHSVYMNQTKEEREAKSEKVYVGSGKELVFEKKTETVEANVQNEDPDALPF